MQATGTEAPTPIVMPVYRAPKTPPRPECGKPARRKRTVTRRVRAVAYKAVAYLEITSGEYAARRGGSATFRSTHKDVLPRAAYDNKVRESVLDRILKDGTSVERALRSLRRELLLDLSTGFVYDVLRDQVARLDLATRRRKALEHFSGARCVDGLHLGRFTLPLAADPLSGLPVAFAWVAPNDRDHMRRFLGNLKARGLAPGVVVTDGSNLYPNVLSELWPDADHQLCVFHVIKDINQLTLDAVRRMRTAVGRRGRAGREKKRGRKGAEAESAAKRRGPTVKEKARFAFKHRYPIVKRREGLPEAERDDLRRFADRIYRVFGTPKDRHQASCRRSAVVRDAAFRAVPELVKAMKHLGEERFAKLMAYLDSAVGQRARTNNQVERTNRMFRFPEKVRSRYRGRRARARFVVLTLDAIWREWAPAEAPRAVVPDRARDGGLQIRSRQRSSRAA